MRKEIEKRESNYSSICIRVGLLIGICTMRDEFGGNCLLSEGSDVFIWLAVVLLDPLPVATWHVQLGNSNLGFCFKGYFMNC